ncbi:MAG TPA: SRPBCC family protein [Thermoanaerobaculia bacterium]|nr:SRPBCC family protein [Thermoanaerobaculia bacterium]
MTVMNQPETAQTATEMSVKKSVMVEAPQAHAFAVFTERQGGWWPLASHHIGKVQAETAVLEPRAGGRWYERGVDGSECEWGRVLVWEPPHRVVLGWELAADWRHDPSLQTEVEVRFVAVGPQTTRVELEHRHLERYGDKAEQMKAGLGSEGGWTGILQIYAAAAATPA